MTKQPNSSTCTGIGGDATKLFVLIVGTNHGKLNTILFISTAALSQIR